MATPPLRPRKQPRQTRSIATVEVILEAAARVLAAESLGGFNTNRVAEVAGISVGSLYQYFPNKSALVAALIERKQNALADAVEACIQALRDRSLEAALRGLAELAVAQQFEEPLLAAALDHEEQRLPMDRALARSQTRIVAAVDGLLARHRGQLGAGLPASAAHDCMVIAKALVESAAASSPVERRGLAARVYRALLGYLTIASTRLRG